jgi:hypothetical protein
MICRYRFNPTNQAQLHDTHGLARTGMAVIGTTENAGSPAHSQGRSQPAEPRGPIVNPQEEAMRIPMIVATAVLLTASAGAASAAPTMDVPYLVSMTVQDPPAPPKGGDVKVDIDLDGDGRTIWYTDPLWIVLGAAAVIVVVALVAAAARGGGGTTVIR